VAPLLKQRKRNRGGGAGPDTTRWGEAWVGGEAGGD
jgi:hypothetical protein